MDLTPLQLDDFSGGLTDFPVGARPNELSAAKNIIITIDKKPRTRPGSLKEGTTDTYAKLPFPVNGLISNLDYSGPPYKLCNSDEVTSSDRRGRAYANNGTTHVELVGPVDSNPLFTNDHAISSTPRFITATWNDHHYVTSESFTQKVQKIYADSAGLVHMRTAGLPKPAQSTLTFSAAAGALSRAYAIGYKYTYTSGVRTFIDRSPLMRYLTSGLSQIYTGADPGPAAAANVVGNFPVLDNGTTDNYDTATIEIELYRTTNGGKIFYLVGTVTNGTTSLSDEIPDATLLTKATHYITSGQPDFDPPPVCKFMHITERGIGLYGYIQDGSDTLKNRFVQSIIGAPDKVPAVFNGDVDEPLTGVSSYRGTPLFFTRTKIYRGEGNFTASGSGALVAKKITDAVGCISHTSIVQTPDGLFFAGEKGFYWTDGYTVTSVSDKIRLTYARVYASISGSAIQGAYDPEEKRIFWTYPDTTNSDGIFVLHTRFGLDAGGCFTLLGGETTETSTELGTNPTTLPTTITQNFRASCLLHTLGRMYRGDERGYAFYFDEITKTDPRVVTSEDMSDWGTTAISYDCRTVYLNFGTNFVRKWTPKAILTFKNHGNMSLRVLSDRDMEGRPKQCKEFKKRSEYSWGDPKVWGDPIIYASDKAIYEEIRMMPTPGVRCSYRSIYLKNAFTVINKSDTLGLGALDATAKTLTLLTPGQLLPLDIRDLYLSFPDQSTGLYTLKFLITSHTTTVATISDPDNILSDLASTPWQLMGISKGDIMELQSMVIPYTLLTSTQGVYTSGSEGGNS